MPLYLSLLDSPPSQKTTSSISCSALHPRLILIARKTGPQPHQSSVHCRLASSSPSSANLLSSPPGPHLGSIPRNEILCRGHLKVLQYMFKNRSSLKAWETNTTLCGACPVTLENSNSEKRKFCNESYALLSSRMNSDK